MTTFRDWMIRWGWTPDTAVWRAAAYLERQGQVFLVHFGVQNAVDKAREHWRSRRPRKKAGR